MFGSLTPFVTAIFTLIHLLIHCVLRNAGGGLEVGTKSRILKNLMGKTKVEYTQVKE